MIDKSMKIAVWIPLTCQNEIPEIEDVFKIICII
jgi:hypothetical protein